MHRPKSEVFTVVTALPRFFSHFINSMHSPVASTTPASSISQVHLLPFTYYPITLFLRSPPALQRPLSWDTFASPITLRFAAPLSPISLNFPLVSTRPLFSSDQVFLGPSGRFPPRSSSNFTLSRLLFGSSALSPCPSRRRALGPRVLGGRHATRD